jgi:hypothetical protein
MSMSTSAKLIFFCGKSMYLESIWNKAKSVMLRTKRDSIRLTHRSEWRVFTLSRFQMAILTRLSRMPCSNIFGNPLGHCQK